MRCSNQIIEALIEVLLVVVIIIIKILAVIAIAFCFIVPPFLATAVICYYLPFIREPIIFELTALVMFVAWLVVIVYIFLPMYDRLEDKWFIDSAGAIVAYNRMKWSAKLVDEKKNQGRQT
jgi:hypothetical protein